MSRGAKTRTSNSKNLRRQKQRAGVATAALLTAAMGVTVGAGAGQASILDDLLDLLPVQSCEGGSGTVNDAVDCQWSIDPPIAGLLPALGLDLGINSGATARKDINIPIPLFPDVQVGGTTAKISGVGLAYANSAFAAPGSSAEAHAWGFLSGAVAVTLPPDSIADLLDMEPGHTKAISLPLGITVAAAGSGEATAFALGGFATAIGFTDLVENVSCMALVSYASHSDVGTCVGVLFIFSVSQEAGSNEYVFAIADPTSLKILSNQGLIPLPIPSFDRDILRIGFGGPSGVRVESDLLPTASLASSTLSTSAAPVAFAAAADDVPVVDVPADDDSAADDASASTEYVGKHRAPAGAADTADVDITDVDSADADTTGTETADVDAESDSEPDTLWTEPEVQTPASSAPASGTETADAA